ncbi:hypothetical protein [Nocardia uniformis]|nr:hypothetical protein [Nocardia uniformis]
MKVVVLLSIPALRSLAQLSGWFHALWNACGMAADELASRSPNQLREVP